MPNQRFIYFSYQTLFLMVSSLLWAVCGPFKARSKDIIQKYTLNITLSSGIHTGLCTVSVLRFFVHSVFCHFSCRKSCIVIFFCEIPKFTSRLMLFDNFFKTLLIFYVLKLNFHLEA